MTGPFRSSPGGRPHTHEHPHSHTHEHPHSHTHGHSHTHEHSHHHGHPFTAPVASMNRPILPGSAAQSILFLDMPSGISGDMTVAALLDLGIPIDVVRECVSALGLEGVDVHVEPARSGAIGGSKFEVRVSSPQPDRTYRDIDRLLERAPLNAGTKELARRIFRRLAEAESEVHRVPIDEVAFHEVGSADSIVDIVGAAACLTHLGARVIASPVPLGRGSIDCQHGRIPLPAPATLLCLKAVPTYDSGLSVELVTPTGAAIVSTVAERFVAWPELVPERVGVGCGTRVLEDRANALRAILGTTPHSSDSSHVLLEANVDDMTGELAGHAIRSLLDSGALDAWASAVTMKKGRPGLVLHALAERSRADHVASALFRETSSIGVRRSLVSRTERPRRVVEVQTAYGAIPVKVSEGDFGPPQIKPEFDACVQAAQRSNVPVRVVLAAAIAAYGNDPA